jgi:WhiB family transcriptional regulator, redox-sensing transcriptional regulator
MEEEKLKLVEEKVLQLGAYTFTGDPHQEEWALQAACRSTGDLLFVRGAEQNKIARGCGGCAVQAACLRDAIESRDPWGIRGGLTERQRRKLVKDLGGFVDTLEIIDHDREEAKAKKLEQNNNPIKYTRLASPLRLAASGGMGLDTDTQKAS